MAKIEPQDQSLKNLKGLHLWHAPMSSCSQRVRITLAEKGEDFESHLIHLEKNEHASPEYQKIHPKGVVPAFVDNGELLIESIDIIQHIAGENSDLFKNASPELLNMANEAQGDLKLLTFEFLFKGMPSPPPEVAKKFQDSHQNDTLRAFKKEFAKGFDQGRVNEAIARTDKGFRHLNELLSDGRKFLEGKEFSLSDIAWMPNIHRMKLMDWPFETVPNLQGWFERISERTSYKVGLTDWQNEKVAGAFENYTKTRQEEGTDVRSFPHFKDS